MPCNKPCDKNPCQDIEVQELAELPIDNLASIPDYFLTEREVIDETTGRAYHSITRTPGSRLFPTGAMANSFTLDGNNDKLEIIEGQPTPAYVQKEATENIVYEANATHPAQFLIVGKIGDLLLCQNTGVVIELKGHSYIVGAQYYLGADGGVTTTASQTGQKLFIPISDTKLLINL